MTIDKFALVLEIRNIVEQIDLLLELDNLAQAHELAAEILDTADPDTLELLACIGWDRQNNPNTAEDRLRDMWKRSTPEYRELIATCVDLHVPPSALPTDTVAPAGAEVLRADVHVATHAEAPELHTGRPTDTSRCDTVRRRFDETVLLERRTDSEIQTAIQCAKTIHSYRWKRAGVDDQPAVKETPIHYEIDYDKAAIPPVRGLRCVHCWCERSARDNWRHNDGLCDCCRSLNRPGLEDLPATAWRDEVIANRCTFIATNFPAPTALTILRQDYTGYANGDRIDLKRWVQHYYGPATTKPATRTAHHATAA
ncbi:hypothetical protein [Lentzea sp. NPDC059081]|uniref:hypothetical protein n=1 Tax=Lentzea sp. NPDC059081 TaxID=3346719 RepID=UPI0036B8A389